MHIATVLPQRVNSYITYAYATININTNRNYMAVLCEMPTIQYLARIAWLSVHKLFTSCIRWCLESRASNRVMSALSAVLLI